MQASRPTVLVATDFTPASRSAFDQGLELAKDLDGRLLLVHAVRPLGAPGLELTRPDTTKAENETAGPPAIGLAGTEWVDLANAHGIEADVVVRPGLPALVIAEEAERIAAHSIVLGSQGKTGITRVMLGSVADEVRANTTRPVIVVPDEDADVGAQRPPRPPTRRQRLLAMLERGAMRKR